MSSHSNEHKSATTPDHQGTVSIRTMNREVSFVDVLTVPGVMQGLGATIRHFFVNLFGKEKYRQTISYPDEKVEYPERFRGMHRLVPREDGSSRCVACYMCQTACPARCIKIIAGETEDGGIEKYPVSFEIDELRCVVCGLCVEACPCDAIRMDTGFHPAPVYEADQATFGKAQLLEIRGRHEPEGSRDADRPPATAAGTGRVDRSAGDRGAGGSAGGYEHNHHDAHPEG